VEKAETRLAPSAARVDGEEGWGDGGGVVDDPAEESVRFSVGRTPERMGVMAVAVAGGGDVDGYVFAAFDVDDFMIVEEGLPGAVLGWYWAVDRRRGCVRCRCPGRWRRGW